MDILQTHMLTYVLNCIILLGDKKKEANRKYAPTKSSMGSIGVGISLSNFSNRFNLSFNIDPMLKYHLSFIIIIGPIISQYQMSAWRLTKLFSLLETLTITSLGMKALFLLLNYSIHPYMTISLKLVGTNIYKKTCFKICFVQLEIFIRCLPTTDILTSKNISTS